MPLRIIAYDGANYRSQLLELHHKKNYPVISLVLYFGTKRWYGKKHLKEILEIPPELEPYVKDYKIHVVEVAWLTDKQIQMYKSDFRVVAEFFSQKRRNMKYTPTPQELKHVDAVLKLLEVFGGAYEFRKTYNKIRAEKTSKGGVTMCEFVQRTIRNGVERGIAEEMVKIKATYTAQIKEEVTAQVTEQVTNRTKSEFILQSVTNLQKNLNLSLDAALNALGKTILDYENAKSELSQIIA